MQVSRLSLHSLKNYFFPWCKVFWEILSLIEHWQWQPWSISLLFSILMYRQYNRLKNVRLSLGNKTLLWSKTQHIGLELFTEAKNQVIICRLVVSRFHTCSIVCKSPLYFWQKSQTVHLQEVSFHCIRVTNSSTRVRGGGNSQPYFLPWDPVSPKGVAG